MSELNSRRLARRQPDWQVDPDQHPGWIRGSERMPASGEQVFCAEGEAEVVRILGKTSNGDRILELRVADGRRHPYFAAADNILVQPATRKKAG
jgi:hypothetical protein